MVTRKVLILINKNFFDKEYVKSEIKAERYEDDFFFDCPKDLGEAVKFIQSMDEVWCFGNCEELPLYKVCVELGSDIWRMA